MTEGTTMGQAQYGFRKTKKYLVIYQTTRLVVTWAEMSTSADTEITFGFR